MNHKEMIKNELDKFDYNNSKLKLTFGVLVVVILCTFLIVIATFTELAFIPEKLPRDGILHPIKYIQSSNLGLIALLGFRYVPQVPVVMFIAGLLGSKFGFLSVLLYVVLGLTAFPIFALGGGLSYIYECNFGYILAYIPAVIIAGKILGRKITLRNAVKAAFFGVLTIHFIGLLHTTLVVIFTHGSMGSFKDLIAFQSGIKVFYDYFLALIAIMFARPAKKILWLAMG